MAPRLLLAFDRASLIAPRSLMARLEGKKPDAGAIIIGAVIFTLIAAGLFFAFRPVPEPTDAGLSNSTSATNEASDSTSSDMKAMDATNRESTNSLTTILTPLPMATPAPTTAQMDGAASSTDNSAPAATAATAPVATVAASSAEETSVTPAANNVSPTPNAP